MSTTELFSMSPNLVARTVKKWWLAKAEMHYLRCADVERARAREAHLNAAYYQKQAAITRSNRVQ